MKAISYLLDPASGASARPDENATEAEEITSIRRIPRLPERILAVTKNGQPPRVALDEDACNAFDRRPPLESMGALWLTRSGVVTVYDCGHDGDHEHAVYDAVFRLHDYVWIRSPGPVLRDNDLD